MTDTKHSADLPPLPKSFAQFSDICGTLFVPDHIRNAIERMAKEYARAAIAAAAPIPEGCARAWNGTIYHNITEIYHRMEEGEALHMVLDDKKIPRADADGAIYSLVGRVARLSEAAPKAALTDEQVNELAEAAYWNFDARKKGYAEWKQCPQSERDAFKAEFRIALAAAGVKP